MSLQSQINDLRKAITDLISNSKKYSDYNELQNPQEDDYIGVQQKSTGNFFWIKLKTLASSNSISSFGLDDVTDFGLKYTFGGNDLVLDLSSILKKTIVNGNIFTFSKNPNNNVLNKKNVLEINDMIYNGWWDSTTYWPQAIYLGGDVNNQSNWKPIGAIKQIPLI